LPVPGAGAGRFRALTLVGSWQLTLVGSWQLALVGSEELTLVGSGSRRWSVPELTLSRFGS
jgi:hypothetical protein